MTSELWIEGFLTEVEEIFLLELLPELHWVSSSGDFGCVYQISIYCYWLLLRYISVWTSSSAYRRHRLMMCLHSYLHHSSMIQNTFSPNMTFLKFVIVYSDIDLDQDFMTPLWHSVTCNESASSAISNSVLRPLGEVFVHTLAQSRFLFHSKNHR